jgi:hypothetical protein
MRSHYPEVFEGPPTLATGHPTGFDGTSMRDTIRDGISADATNMATVMRPLEDAQSKKDKWTDLQKESILKSCGYASTTQWDDESRPNIWDVYEEEGCKAQDIIRVFRKEFNPDTDDVTIDLVEPFVTLHLAKDIRNCPFDYDGTLTYDNCDRGMVPMAVLPRTAEEQSALTEKPECCLGFILNSVPALPSLGMCLSRR